MNSDKKNISLLADIFVKSGLTNIVISPGSRNAPIIISFANRAEINAFSIIDERSAAFFALGLALNSKKTVAIACTSGSAALNYASAISEAYYQKVPLLIITADRPSYMIDIGDGQTIRQNNVFNNYIKSSYQLPLIIETKYEIEKAENLINEALYQCMFPQPGPVHINIPFDEPLYNSTEEVVKGKLFDFENQIIKPSISKVQEIANRWNNSQKVMILSGQASPANELNRILKKLSENQNTILLSETTSNLYGYNFIDTIDNVTSTIRENNIEHFKPEILITFGGQVVSKMIKKFLRTNKPAIHWHISPSDEKMDTYFGLTDTIVSDELEFFKSIIQQLVPVMSDYSNLWHKRKIAIEKKKAEYLSNVEYSDLKVFETITNQLPNGTNLHLGNSTPVRYSQLFGCKKNIIYNSNRGVSGIDGQISTAAGYAFNSNSLNVLITGDLGFLYDSNGLMNKYLPNKLRIIVINNSGGGIFKFIGGPDTTPNLDEFFVTKHNWNAEYICKAFDVNYKKAHNLNELVNTLPNFLNLKNECTEVLEIFTPYEVNGLVLREYFMFIKN